MRSNMDIQYILDCCACCQYVVNYVSKGDIGVSKALGEIYQKHRNNPSSKALSMLGSLVNTYYNTSEISAQEAC
ncbi:hypothetical protein EDC96DRAFT_507043 [Choanephora cucurbitarum]|nr:hypothetical protein EDC96DRAFT_507043 [Choanephora cucurbitarum]